jgi:flagellar biosynthetic protein FliR
MTELIAQLSQISGLAEGYVWLFGLVFLRVGAMVALFPALGEQVVPQRIKLAAAVSLTAIVAPLAGTPEALPQGLVLPLVAEAGTGLILGFGLRLMILGLQSAGTIAAQSVSLAQMFAGTGPEPQPIVANLLVLAALALFVATGGLARAADLLAQSYQIVPPGQLSLAQGFTEWGLSRISSVFALAFTLAAPFVLAALLYNLALGAINRAMPQLMVSFVGAPALTLGGLALLALCTPFLLAAWQEAMQAALAQPFGG